MASVVTAKRGLQRRMRDDAAAVGKEESGGGAWIGRGISAAVTAKKGEPAARGGGTA